MYLLFTGPSRWFICDRHNNTQAPQFLGGNPVRDPRMPEGAEPTKGRMEIHTQICLTWTPAIPYWLQMCPAQGSFDVSSLLSNLGKVQGGWGPRVSVKEHHLLLKDQINDAENGELRAAYWLL